MYPEGVEKYLKRSLDLLKTDYVDLYLIHVPFRFRDIDGDLHPHRDDGEMDRIDEVDHVAIWKEMEKTLIDGKSKAIGVSNFNRKQIQRILDNCTTPPVCLQVELHAYNQQKDLLSYCKTKDILMTAYSPLGSPGLGKFLARFGQQLSYIKCQKCFEVINFFLGVLAKRCRTFWAIRSFESWQRNTRKRPHRSCYVTSYN